MENGHVKEVTSRAMDFAGPETERRAALYRLQLLHTAPEAEFDGLVELAASICSVPISLISLLDGDRQWCKAVHGADIREIPREFSMCEYAVRLNDLLQVEDTTRDSRFASNPFVTAENGVRFYAGVPVSSPEGIPLGALCVMDRVPRRLTELQASVLRVLGRQVNLRLELRAQRLALREALSTAEDARRQVEKANVRLRELAATDPLTGLANRRVFDERLALEFARARRKDRDLTVVLMDIDNFKQRNDRFGHMEGDATLKRFAAILKALVRETDLVVRYGGEEFAVLLPEASEADALATVERILDGIRSEPWSVDPVRASAGLASMDSSVRSEHQLVSLADKALYAAKFAGKDCAVAYGDRARESADCRV